MVDGSDKNIIPTDAIPARSRLYSLIPQGMGSSEIECLTSYINRLAWAYRIGSRLFIVDTILPNLNESRSVQLLPNRLAPFCREEAMRINAAGESAVNWSNVLEKLTMRTDLRDLTLRTWASALPYRGLLRNAPAWCPACYTQWKESTLPIYQPLCWMFQVNMICLQHRRRLEAKCPNCQKPQSAIATKTRPGYCTQCAAWLGKPPDSHIGEEIDDEIFTWQQWIIRAIIELHQAGATSGSLSWEQCTANIAICAQAVGGVRPLARIIGLPPSVPRNWVIGVSIPSFKCLLELCYVLDISPLQLLLSDQESLVTHLQTGNMHQQPLSNRLTYNHVNRKKTLDLFDAILSGKEAPLAIRQAERRLDLGDATLTKRFPEECALLTAQYQIYRSERSQQKIERECDEVRQTTIALHEQGINPSKYHLAAKLSDPDLMRRPECRKIWHKTRRELGLES